VARVIAFVPDLLFGSNVLGAIEAAGHEAVLAGDIDTVHRELSGSELLIVDLTSDAEARTDAVAGMRGSGVRTLGFYSHVEADVRTRAEQAGFDLVVPRSRMAREGSALVSRLLSGRSEAAP
jgi:hypothetical protein